MLVTGFGIQGIFFCQSIVLVLTARKYLTVGKRLADGDEIYSRRLVRRDGFDSGLVIDSERIK